MKQSPLTRLTNARNRYTRAQEQIAIEAHRFGYGEEGVDTDPKTG